MELKGTVVFSSGKAGDFDIWTIELESGQLKQLTHGQYWNDSPRWSPDGKQITFISNRTGVPEVWLMDEDGGSQTQLTSNDKFHSGPVWSPDGKKIAFCANYETPNEIEIWAVDAKGGEPEVLITSPGMETEPSWSPDGKKMIFAAPRSGDYDIWEYTIDSKEFRQLTNHSAKDFAPSYSPDGNLIAFVSTRDPNNEDETKDTDIWLMKADGSEEPQRLTTNKGQDLYVTWSPDGKGLVYCAGGRSNGTGRIQFIDLEKEKVVRYGYNRSELEQEIGSDVRRTGLNLGLFTLVLPKAIRRQYYPDSYFGKERHPHWKH